MKDPKKTLLSHIVIGRASLIALLTIVLFSYQNCSPKVKLSTSQPTRVSGNGDGFEGKLGLPVANQTIISEDSKPEATYEQISEYNSCEVDQVAHAGGILRAEFTNTEVALSCIDPITSTTIDSLVKPFSIADFPGFQPFNPEVFNIGSALLSRPNQVPSDSSLFCRRNSSAFEDGTDLILRNIDASPSPADEVYDFQSSSSLPPQTRFNRASQATYWSQSGVLNTATNDEPRLEYGPSGEPLGLLLEESSANLLLRSNDFANATWTRLNANVINSATEIGPDAASVNVLSETAANGFHYIQQTTNMDENTNYVLSVFAKPIATGRSVSVRLYSVDETQTRCTLNFETKTLSSLSGNISSCWFEELPNNWFRVSVRRNSRSQSGSSSSRVKVELFHNTLGGSYAGTAHPGVLIFGAQLERESFASSYIATGATTVARAADSLVVRDGASSEDPASVVLDYDFKDDSQTQALVEFQGASAGQLLLTPDSVDSNLTGSRVDTPIVKNNFQKLALAIDSSNFDLFSQGANIQSGSVSRGSGLAQLLFGGSRQGFYLRRLDVYHSGLLNSTLAELSNPFVQTGQPHVVLLSANVDAISSTRVETAPVLIEESSPGVFESSKFLFNLQQISATSYQLQTKVSGGREFNTVLTCYPLEPR
ncbi:MAG: hypothetical protein HRT45_07790 [Bdellovibrionales bacterium]|nr:hypothetical protein [Bdellovibrionales bacterium]